MRISPSWRVKSLGAILLVSALASEARPSAPQMRTRDIAPTPSLPSGGPAKVSRPQELLRRSSFGLQATERRASLDRKADAAGLGLGFQQAIEQFRALTLASADGSSGPPTGITSARADRSPGDLDEIAASPPAIAPASFSGSGIFLSNLHAAAFSSLQHTWRAADTLHLSAVQRKDTQDALANLHLWARELVGERLDTAIAGDEQLAKLVAGSLRRINALLGSEVEVSGDEEEGTDPYEATYYETKLLMQLMPAIEQRLAFLEG